MTFTDPVKIFSPDVTVTQREDGVIMVTPNSPLAPYCKRITDKLDQWAGEKPETLFLAQRGADGHFEGLSYGEALDRVKSIATFLLGQQLSAERPLIIMSGNSIEHMLMGLAAMYVGIPYAPISPAYSLVSKGFGKLRYIYDKTAPGLLFVDSLGPYRDAIDAVIDDRCAVVAVETMHGTDGISFPLIEYSDVATYATDEEAVALANSRVTPDTVAKLLFTSGSTGMPKGVVNTQKMLCSNQEIIRSYFAFLKEEPPVLVDWLPWNHTFGGNKNVGLVLYNGGTLYIDEGKPTEQLMAKTVKNLGEIAPTLYFNVPKGFELLVHELKSNPDVARNFFSRVKVLFFAGAGLSEHVWKSIDDLSIEYTGSVTPILSGLGATETGPSVMFTRVEESASGVVGVPSPGVSIKLVPNSGKLEVRVKSDSVTPCYWRDETLNQDAFDDEGFYCLGDALRFIDPEHPERGLIFDGRISEDFKLDTGTWVSAGVLRTRVIHHFAPYIQDVVIIGRDRSFLSALVFPDIEQCKRLIGGDGPIEPGDLIEHPRVKEAFSNLLRTLSESSTGQSNRIRRLCLLSVPARLDAGEATDKGSLNALEVERHRSEEISDLYRKSPSSAVISI